MIAAVDCGSTNTKAALFDGDGRRLANASRPLPYTVHTNTRAELDPGAVRDCFFGVLDDLCRAAEVARRDITRVSFTSQAQTFVILDAAGVPLSPFYGWTDARAEQEAAELRTRVGEGCHARYGWARVGPLQMVSKVLWSKRHHHFSKTMRVVSLPSYLAMQLGAVHASDTNLAAMSGFYSIFDSGWCPQMLDAIGCAPAQLGALVQPGELLEKAGDPWDAQFSPALRVVMACNDHTAGAVGSGCRPGRSTLTLGTAGVIYRFAGQTMGPFPAGGLWGPFPGGGFYELLCLDHACSALDWADEFLFGGVDSPRFVQAAERATVSGATPFFYPKAWGSVEAWRGEGDADARAYAVLEGIGFALLHLGGETFFGTGDEVVALGGGSRLDAWLRLVADIFGCSLVRGQRDGLDGAARIAGVPVPDAGHAGGGEVLAPGNRDRKMLQERYQRWISGLGS